MKGIYQQIREEKFEPNISITKKNLEEFFKSLEKAKVSKRKEISKRDKENREHLEKRAKELNKEIPIELYAYCVSAINPSNVLPKWLIDKYKEWL